MNTQDAANLLELSGDITPELVKEAYRRAAMKFHPDRNPSGLHMMQAINAAYALLKSFTGSVNPANNYGDMLSAALNAIQTCQNITIEVCGNWVWVSGETKAIKDILKAAGYHYSGQKKMWYFRPEEWKSANRKQNSIEKIREVYGSQAVQTKVAESIT